MRNYSANSPDLMNYPLPLNNGRNFLPVHVMVVAGTSSRPGFDGDYFNNKSYKPGINAQEYSSFVSGESKKYSFRFIVGITVVSMFFTALLMSINTFPVSFQMIASGVSLLAGFIIEFMFSGDKYE